MITEHDPNTDYTDFVGAVRGMPEHVYRQADSVSQTQLKQWAISAADGMLPNKFNAKESASATKGTATHCLLLDGKYVFDERYRADGPVNPTTGKMYGRTSQKYQDWLDKQDSEYFLTDAEYEEVIQMVETIKRDPFAYSIITMPGSERELSLFWVEHVDGQAIRCKARLDWYNHTHGIVDLKTADETEPDEFSKKVGNMKYHAQAWFYPRGVMMTGLKETNPSWGWIVLQNQPPYKIACYKLEGYQHLHGQALIWRGLKNMARIMAGGNPHENITGFREIRLPSWFWESDESISTAKEEAQ